MNFKAWGGCLVTILILDFIWLKLVAAKFYVDRITDVGLIENGRIAPNFPPAGVVYFLLSGGIMYFALPRIPADAPLWQSFLMGGALGIVIYGVYDFTNSATLKQWPISLAIVDTLWGGFICGAAVTVAKLIRDS